VSRERERAIRVMVADDHFIVREGLRLILETDPDMELVGDAADGASAVRLAGELEPDVVLMDVRMPGLDGLQAIEQIRARWPRIALVILTTYQEDEVMLRGLQAGACGYLLKDASRETLLDAIRMAARGETLLQPDALSRLLARTPDVRPAPDGRAVTLTEREREVLQRVVQGERSKEIAACLGIAERTVKAYLSSIYNKLDVDSRAAAAAKALASGLLSPPRAAHGTKGQPPAAGPA
jgi:two-component system, NarL family, response regulator YdfI